MAIDVNARMQAALEGPYGFDEADIDEVVLALSGAGVVVLAQEDYDALVVAGRSTRDTDADELRPTLAPEDVCDDCGDTLDDGTCWKCREL